MPQKHIELEDTLLGKPTVYPNNYSPKILCPIPRSDNRKQLNMEIVNQFYGFDLWNAYEISWLNNKGKPVIATGIFIFPFNSRFLVESKSLKLYLNSLNNGSYSSIEEVTALIKKDLSDATQSDVMVELLLSQQWQPQQQEKSSKLLDHLDVAIDCYDVNANLLECENIDITETLYSHLLKTNCPITGQPDWATLYIQYSGKKINPQSLLKYIVSFRNHNDFHEHCVERIFVDIIEQCSPDHLTVTARFTRRGGLDINPCRSTHPQITPSKQREFRQ